MSPDTPNGASPPGRRRTKRQLKRDLIEAAVRENEALLGRRPQFAADGDSPPVQPSRRFSPWSLLLLVPIAAAAALGYLELNRTEPDVSEEASAEIAPQEPEIMFTGAPETLDAGVFPLSVKRIVLDPGHGGAASGAMAEGLIEKDLALDITLRLRDLLADPYRVAMTREADFDVDLDRRTRMANRAKADLFVSIHVNWLTRNPNCGVETYYLGPTDDPELTERAERENSEALSYSLADLRQLLDGVIRPAMQEESRALATAVQDALFEGLRASNPRLRNRGTKTAPFVVLIGAEMPAILAEVSCLSDGREVERLREDGYLQAIAEALNTGIRNYADSLLPETLPEMGDAALSSAGSGSTREP